MNSSAQSPFPIELLPPLTKNAIQEVFANVQAPLALIFSSAMGAISLACQSQTIVRRPNGMESPCSLFLLVIAESGERKSAADKYFKRPILDLQQEEVSKSKIIDATHEGSNLAWEAEKTAILSSIKKESKEGSPSELLKDRLVRHMIARPVKPHPIQWIYADVTPEALKYGLYQNGGSAGIISDEADAVFGGRSMGDLAMLNDLWGGETLHVARRGSESFDVHSPRLTLSLMIQPRQLLKHLSRKEGAARDIGFLARCLTAYPPTTQGHRSTENRVPSWEHVPIFQKRLATILNQHINRQCTKTVLEFTADAKIYWVNEQNRVEVALRPGGFLSEVKDFASKFSENVARMAALLHYFEGYVGDISLETTTCAIAICSWYMDEFKRIFSEDGALCPGTDAARRLENWFSTKVASRGASHLKVTNIQQHGPSSLRRRVELEPALARLAAEGKIWFEMLHGHKYIFLSPLHFHISASTGAMKWGSL